MYFGVSFSPKKRFKGKTESLLLLHWFNLVCLGSHLKLVLMLKLLFFRNRWLVCLKLCNGKSWWVPSFSLWFVKCSVNAVERAVDPLISLYIHCVYGVCLASAHFMSHSGLQLYIFSTLPKLGLSGFFPGWHWLVCYVMCCVTEEMVQWISVVLSKAHMVTLTLPFLANPEAVDYVYWWFLVHRHL